MCKILNISRSTYYYQPKDKSDDSKLEAEVLQVFNDNRKAYGTRKIKASLSVKASRRTIGKIMKRNNLISVYTKRKFKANKSSVNNEPIKNELNRHFNDRQPLEAVVTDLTYVDVSGTWHYVCLILDLFNREVIGYSVGRYKTAELVKQALATIPYDCSKIKLFHTDRGSEFDNKLIDEFLEVFDITRSLSHKGTPYDNAVAESTYKSFKAEFIYQEQFDSLEELQIKTFDFINWWNNIRVHSSLNYKTPAQVRAEV